MARMTSIPVRSTIVFLQKMPRFGVQTFLILLCFYPLALSAQQPLADPKRVSGLSCYEAPAGQTCGSADTTNYPCGDTARPDLLFNEGMSVGAKIDSSNIEGKFVKNDGEFRISPVAEGDEVQITAYLMTECRDVLGASDPELVLFFGEARAIVRMDPQRTTPPIVVLDSGNQDDGSSAGRPIAEFATLNLPKVFLEPVRLPNSVSRSVRGAQESVKLGFFVCSETPARDSSSGCDGSGVAKASVTLIDPVANQIYPGFADADGRYDFPEDVPLRDAYIVAVTAHGFESVSAPLLRNGAELAFPDPGAANYLLLRPRDEPTPVSDDDFISVLSNVTPARSFSFDSRSIAALPMGRIRNLDSLALLAPGVVPAPQTFESSGPGIAPGLGTAGQYSVNGMRARQNSFTVDGADNNEEDVGVRRQGFLASFPQSIETVEEFQLITAMADARFGRSVGGQIDAISKFGDLGLHTSAYGFLTDSKLRAFGPFDTGGSSQSPVAITSDGTATGQRVRFVDVSPLDQARLPFEFRDDFGFSPGPPGDENPLTLCMSRESTTTTSPAYERILSTATDLFYRQGYRATGINEVIEKSRVAKATFYKHFPTKDELCLAFLERRNARELGEIDEFIDTRKSPLGRFLAVIESLEPWMVESGFKGCAFLNMVPEVPDSLSALRKEGALHYESLRTRVRRLAEELIEAEPDRYGHLDSRTLADDYMVVLTGSIALSEISHDIWPVRQGIETVKRLIR